MSILLAVPRDRFPRMLNEVWTGDAVIVSDGAETRVDPSSTRVTSVSLEESVPAFSPSSSSSSFEVTSASFASSMLGLTAGSSQYSRFQNRSAS